MLCYNGQRPLPPLRPQLHLEPRRRIELVDQSLREGMQLEQEAPGRSSPSSDCPVLGAGQSKQLLDPLLLQQRQEPARRHFLLVRTEAPVNLREQAVPDCDGPVPVPAEELDRDALQLEQVAAGDLELVLEAAETLQLGPRLPPRRVDKVRVQLGRREEAPVGGQLGYEGVGELLDKRVLPADKKPKSRPELLEGVGVNFDLPVDDGQQDLSVVPAPLKVRGEQVEFDRRLSKSGICQSGSTQR